MGYRGKLEERARARELRAQSWTLEEIAEELGVSKSSVSLWVRDVAFEPRLRRVGARTVTARRRGPNVLSQRKQAQIEELRAWGRRRIGRLSEREFLVAGVALYAGEGTKRDGDLRFANSDPRQILFFCAWLRHFFHVDESRLRVRLYLHQGLDLDAAIAFWSGVTEIPGNQFLKPYRAVPDGSIRSSKHVHGCPSVGYNSSPMHRAVMGLVDGLLDGRALDAVEVKRAMWRLRYDDRPEDACRAAP